MIKKLQNFDIAQIAASGQCFRMRLQEDGNYLAIAGDKAVIISQIEPNLLEFGCNEQEFMFWHDYFDLDTDYSRFCGAIPDDDDFLQEAVKFGWGLRILKQDLWEMIVSFIISQNNNIPRIQSSIEKLCTAYGKKQMLPNGETYFGFPSQESLKTAELADLRAMGLGYRDQYLYTLARTPLPLDELKSYNWVQAHKLLTSFLGIGPKVANCVCLFGLHQMDAFPVDTWIRKTIAEYYDGHFPLERYEGFAGVIQQYMFYYGRSAKILKKDK